MKQLTEIQRETLEFVRAYIREHGCAPARPEIMSALRLKNKSVVDQRLFALERKGFVELRPGSPRYIKLLDEDLPLIIAGTVAAGEPILADERVKCRIPRAVAEMFRPEPDFFVRVQGDSMNRLGLVTGSVVACRSQSTARTRDVVVARLGDAVTLKRFVRLDRRRVELRPESTNLEHKSIEVDLKRDAFEICGIAVGALIGDGFNRPGYELESA